MSEENRNVDPADDEDPFAVLREYSLMKQFDELSFRQKWSRVFRGLRQPLDHGEHKWARLQMIRLLSPLMAVLIPILMLFLIALLAKFNPQPTPSFQVTVVDPTPMEKLDIVEPEHEQHMLEPPDPIDVSFDLAAELPSLPTDTISPPADTASAQPASFDSVAMIRSPVIMTGIMGSRNPGSRGVAINRYGGKWGAQSHAALLKALQWLKENQRPDGSWIGQGAAAVSPAMTGLGLLTFLADIPGNPNGRDPARTW